MEMPVKPRLPVLMFRERGLSSSGVSWKWNMTSDEQGKFTFTAPLGDRTPFKDQEITNTAMYFAKYAASIRDQAWDWGRQYGYKWAEHELLKYGPYQWSDMDKDEMMDIIYDTQSFLGMDGWNALAKTLNVNGGDLELTRLCLRELGWTNVEDIPETLLNAVLVEDALGAEVREAAVEMAVMVIETRIEHEICEEQII